MLTRGFVARFEILFVVGVGLVFEVGLLVGRRTLVVEFVEVLSSDGG